jgi:tRNA A-37 threonylcarbamoyl transferase component Bud32
VDVIRAGLQPGDPLGSYVVEAHLASGGMASVYRVRHTYLDTVHALKLVHRRSRGLRQRLWLEGQVQSGIVHDNVVQIQEMLVHDDCPGLVLEYVDGPTLEELLAAGPLPLDLVDALASDIVSGVRAAHATGVVHRDLKPANILLAGVGDGWRAKVGDFGIARGRGATNLTQQGVPMGTPHYMAPEQWAAAHQVDARADLFSIGCMLYEMLTDRYAFPGDTLGEVQDSIRSGRYIPVAAHRDGVPQRLLTAIERCLRVDPPARPADCDELLAMLRGEQPEAVTAPVRFAATEPMLPERALLPRRPGRGPMRAALAAPLAVGLAVGIGWSATRPPGELAPPELPSDQWVASVTPPSGAALHAPPRVPIEPRAPVGLPSSAAPPGATVTFAGADAIVLEGPSARIDPALGEPIPPGTWSVLARFAGGAWTPSPPITLAEGDAVHLRCDLRFARCRQER